MADDSLGSCALPTDVAGTADARSAPQPPESIVQAVVTGMVVMLAGTIPRNVLFAANLRVGNAVPWAVPVVAAYLWLFWRYLDGAGPPSDTQAHRHAKLRANPLSLRLWAWALIAGGLGLVTLVLGLRLANRLVSLPPQLVPDWSAIPATTVWSLMLSGAPVAGIIEEAAFRGYMQQPIERTHGPAMAILITGTMFALAHLDFTPILWPYYVAVAAIYGAVVFLTNSIWPAIVLHTAGNLYSNTDLLLHGQAEWQTPAAQPAFIWSSGADAAFVTALAGFVVIAVCSGWAYWRLANADRARAANRR